MVQNRNAYNHRGTSYPMEALEPAILEIAILTGRMNQPLNFQLSNSLTKKVSKIEVDVMINLQKLKQL